MAKRKTGVFYDNNLGADQEWLAGSRISSSRSASIRGGPITFDALQNRDFMRRCADSAACPSITASRP